MPDMSYNTNNGQPPMSLVGGGTNVIPPSQTITVPTAILNHPAVQAGVQTAQADMAKKASQMPTGDINPLSSFKAFQAKYPGATQMAYNQMSNMKAMQDSGIMNSFARQHPIINPLASAAAAFGQGLTHQPFYTEMLNNQQSQNSTMADMAKFGQLTPEQMINLGFRRESLDINNQRLQDMQAQRDQVNWSQFINKVNPATASSRSTLGMTANGNMRANRALATIQNNPVMTYQDLGNVIGDLAGIYQGGAPTDMGMKHQQYNSIQTHIANMQQFLTGKPQDAVPPEIKAKITSTIASLKNVNNEALKSNLDSMEKAQKTLISKHPDEWQQFRKGVENDYMNSGNQQQGALTPQGTAQGQSQQNRVGKYTFS